jgi:predicted glutamine amidotransferase
MCRWNAYFGGPLLIDELLYRTKHGLIDESLHSRMGAETTNGDGFGIGWYLEGKLDSPARYRSVNPAWNDANLRDLTGHIESPLFLAHIRAAVGSPVQQTNCHPFRHGRWLFVHNGLLEGFHDVRRDLLLAVDPSLFDGIAGSADSEVLFYLALTLGLEDDVLGAMERAIGLVEATGEAHGIEHPFQGTVAVSDGERLWAVRYSSEHNSRSLFISQDVKALKELHPENPRLQELGDEDRVIVSEPLSDVSGAWLEVPEATALIVKTGADEQLPFRPQRP